jgi:multidrug resistance efflux pump
LNPTRPISRRWWLLAAAMLAVSLAGFAHVLHQAGPSTGGDATAPPREEAPRSIWCRGYVDVEGGVRKILPLQPGRVGEVLARDGDVVAKGAPLLRMEDKLGRQRVEEAKIAVDAAQLELDEARKEPERHANLVEAQKLQVERAKKQVETIRLMDRMKEIQGKGVGISAIDITRTQGELSVAEIALRGEELRLETLQHQDPLFRARLLESKLAGAKARLEQATAASQEYTITAPAAGTVLRVFAGPGDVLTGTSQLPAMEFAPDGARFIRAEVEQAYASRVAKDQLARVQDDTHAPGTWTGRVTYVSDWFAHKRSILQEPLQFNDVRTLEIWVVLDPGQQNLKINQLVRVEILTTK